MCTQGSRTRHRPARAIRHAPPTAHSQAGSRPLALVCVYALARHMHIQLQARGCKLAALPGYILCTTQGWALVPLHRNSLSTFPHTWGHPITHPQGSPGCDEQHSPVEAKC